MSVHEYKVAMADKLAKMAQQLTLSLGQSKRFSYADSRVLELIREMTEIRDLFEDDTSK
jgi:hypothetical protein